MVRDKIESGLICAVVVGFLSFIAGHYFWAWSTRQMIILSMLSFVAGAVAMQSGFSLLRAVSGVIFGSAAMFIMCFLSGLLYSNVSCLFPKPFVYWVSIAGIGIPMGCFISIMYDKKFD